MAAVVLLALVPTHARAQGAPRLEDLKREALAGVERRQGLVQQIVDQLFSYAELGFEEVETARYLTALLQKDGFRIERGVAGMPTAWVATWGSGKPVIGFITDVDCIPRASQKPGVAYRQALVEGAPGHGEGHNSGQAVNVVAALALKELMEKHRIAGTLRLYPGVAEELLAAKAFFVRAGLFKDVDLVLGVHVGNELVTRYGQAGTGLVSVQYQFRGKAAHAAMAPWQGRSALDAVELMDIGWNFRREHLRLEQRSHYVITNGGEQPNVVPSDASVWYYFRELDYPRIQELFALGNTMADAAAAMTSTSVTRQVVGSAWPAHLSKVDRRGPAEEHRGGGHAGVERGRPDPGPRAPEGDRREGRGAADQGRSLEAPKRGPRRVGRHRGRVVERCPRSTWSIPPTSRTCPAIAGRTRWPWPRRSPTKARRPAPRSRP